MKLKNLLYHLKTLDVTNFMAKSHLRHSIPAFLQWLLRDILNQPNLKPTPETAGRLPTLLKKNLNKQLVKTSVGLELAYRRHRIYRDAPHLGSVPNGFSDFNFLP